MKKWFLVLVLVVLVMVFSSYSILAADSIILRWGSVLAGTHPIAQMIDRVAKTVAEKTEGRIEIQNYPAGQLGSSRDQIESVKMGYKRWLPKVWRILASLYRRYRFLKHHIFGGILTIC